MRTLILAALLAAPAVAHADPLAAQSSVTIQDAPRTYIAPGVALGSAGSHTMAAFSFEVGERITDHLVVHGEGLSGVDGLGTTDTYMAATAGLDATSCVQLAKTCAYVGFSAGYAQSKYTQYGLSSTENEWLAPELSGGMSTLSQGAVGVLRAGLDIGNEHLRWRPGVEATLVGPSQAALTSAFALTF